MAEVNLHLVNSVLERCQHSSFYHQHLPVKSVNSWEDFRLLPFTTKEDLRENSPFGFLCVPRQDLRQYHETFGTTGAPVSVWYTAADLDRQAQQLTNLGCGFTKDDTVLVRFPYAISGIAHMIHAAARSQGACVIPMSSRSTISPFPRVVDLMQRLEVTIFAGLPLQAILIAETAELLGNNPRSSFPHLRALCTAGEPLPPSRRRSLERIWGVPVYDNYGMTEIGTAVVDCPYGKSHPIMQDYVFEVLTDDLRSEVPTGEIGWLTVTTLWREATPLIRYLTGDRACLIPHKCPCGQETILRIRGRRENTIAIGERSFDLWDIDRILSKLPSSLFWAAGPHHEGLHVVVEAEHEESSISLDLLHELEDENHVKLAIDILPKGSLYDRSELLTVGAVGKPRYVYSEQEMLQMAYFNPTKI